jgi:hypothetical protein
VKIKEPRKRRPRPDMGWSIIEEGEEDEGTYLEMIFPRYWGRGI